MPFDSGGNFSLVPSYLAITGQTIQPVQHNPPFEDIASAGLSAVLVRDGRAPMTGNLNMGTFQIKNILDGTLTSDAVAVGQVDHKVVIAVKSANYTAVASDNNAMLRFTANVTLNLSPAASLGANWHVDIFADTGNVAVVPNGSETINGTAGLGVQIGQTLRIFCDGSNFFTYGQAFGWKLISDVVTSGASVNFINIGNYRKLRLSGFMLPSTDNVGLLLRTSTDNGATYDSGAATYVAQYSYATSATNTATEATGTGYALTPTGIGVGNAADRGVSFDINLDSFNKATRCFIRSQTYLRTSADAEYVITAGGNRLSSTARTAFQLLFSSGTVANGRVVLEGIAG